MKLTFELQIDIDDTHEQDPLDLPDLVAAAIKSQLTGELKLGPETRLQVQKIELTPRFDFDPGDGWMKPD